VRLKIEEHSHTESYVHHDKILLLVYEPGKRKQKLFSSCCDFAG